MEENAKGAIYFWTAKQFRIFIDANFCKRVFILADTKPCFLF